MGLRPFARPAASKEQRLQDLRRRFAAATPKPPPRPSLPRLYRDRRAAAAGGLILVLLLAWLVG